MQAASTRVSGLQQPPVVRASSMPIAAASAAVVPPVSALLPAVPSPPGLLYVEAHARDPSSLLFCCLCRCSLKRDAATLLAHLEGKRHGDKARAVATIRATLTLRTHSSSGHGGRRMDLGLLPCLNLPAFWKAALSALKLERETSPDALDPSQPLASLELDGRFVLPHVVKLMWLDQSTGALQPLFFSQDFAHALSALEELKQIHLSVAPWNGKINVARKLQQEQQEAAEQLDASLDKSQTIDQIAVTRPMLRAPVRVSRSADATPTKGVPSSVRLHAPSRLPPAAPPRMRRLSSSSSASASDSSETVTDRSRSSGSNGSRGGSESERSSSSAESGSASPPMQPSAAPRKQISPKGLCSFYSPLPSANRCTRARCSWQHRAPTAEERMQMLSEAARSSKPTPLECVQPSKPPLLAHPSHKSRSAGVCPVLKVKTVRGELIWQPSRVPTPYHSPDPVKRAEQQAAATMRVNAPSTAAPSPPTSQSVCSSSEERERASADSSSSHTGSESEMQSSIVHRVSSASSESPSIRVMPAVRSSSPPSARVVHSSAACGSSDPEYLLEADGSPRCPSSASPTVPSPALVPLPPPALPPPSLAFHPIVPAVVSSPVARVLHPNATRSTAAHPPHTRAALLQLEQRVQTTREQSRYSSLFQFDDEHDRGFVAAVAAAAAAAASERAHQQTQHATASHGMRERRTSASSFEFGFPTVMMQV